MPAADRPVAIFYAGTNGAGKSTLRAGDPDAARIQTHIDPDAIARSINPADPRSVDLAAARQALEQFKGALRARQSFSIETTLTGHGVLRRMQEAKRAGFVVRLRYVGLESPDLNVERVALRVAQGGHHIDEDVIRRRYAESLANLVEAARIADATLVRDNSGKGYRNQFSIDDGVLRRRAAMRPWASDAADRIEQARAKLTVIEPATQDAEKLGQQRATMYVIAGPNGAGKSTLYELRIKPSVTAPFINADLIQQAELRDQSVQGAYQAAALAEERRREHLAQRRSFVTESTFSHPSKLQLVDDAKAAGFRVVVYHVGLRGAALSIDRVAARVERGGHDVPADKIIERFERNQPLIRDAVLRADRAFVYDNSVVARPPEFQLEVRRGQVQRIGQELAPWVSTLYAGQLEHVSETRQHPSRSSHRDAAMLAAKLAGKDALTRPGGDTSHFYQGAIVGETSKHWLQQHGDSTFSIHAKAHVVGGVKFGDRVRIVYRDHAYAVATSFAGYPARDGETEQGRARRDAFLALPKREALQRFPELDAAYAALKTMLARAKRQEAKLSAEQRAQLRSRLQERIGDALASGKLPARGRSRADQNTDAERSR